MRLQLLSQHSFLCRRFSTLKFDGKIPLEDLQKTVTLREDQQTYQIELRIPLKSDWIPTKIAEGLRKLYPHRVDRHDQFVIESCRTYSKQLNMADCIDKLRSAMLGCQLAVDHAKNSEEKLNLRLEAKLDTKRRLAAFENKD